MSSFEIFEIFFLLVVDSRYYYIQLKMQLEFIQNVALLQEVFWKGRATLCCFA